MSKRLKRKRRTITTLPQESPRKSRRYWSIFLRALGGMTFCLGLAASVATFLPRITVDSPPQIDPLSPYPIPFTITNIGLVPLVNVQPAIGICELWTKRTSESSHDSRPCEGSIRGRIMMDKWFIKELRADERHLIRLDDLFHIKPPARFGGADISIIVSYQPWLIPFKREFEFRFFTREEKDGTLSWTPRPLDR